MNILGYKKGELLAQGKTKKIWSLKGDDSRVIIESMDDITAGDGAKHDILEGKARFATETTCNVFCLLKRHKVLVSFIKQIDEIHFLAHRCKMIPLEVVVRYVALGSYLKRNLEVESGQLLEDLVVEFYLKTSGRQFNGVKLKCDDPFIEFLGGSIFLYDPTSPISKQLFIESFSQEDVFGGPLFLEENEEKMKIVAKKVFRLLKGAWEGLKLGYTLADFKIEFGVIQGGEANGRLVVSDVIDNDSWRVMNTQGEHIDKQSYRDGESLEEVKVKYEQVAKFTRQF